MDGYRGYRLPPTREEELEILEKWKTKIEEAKTKMDKKLARIEQRIEELKK
jgi:prefoldin subunit 5